MLLVDDDEIAIPDLLVDHRVAADAKDVMVATPADEILGNADRLGHLDRFDRHTCRDGSKQRQSGSTRKDLRRHELDSAALVVRALDVAFALEVCQMFVHRREGVIVKLRRDLLEAGRVAVLFGVGGEVSQYLALAFCERHIPFRGWLNSGPVGRSYRTFAEFLR